MCLCFFPTDRFSTAVTAFLFRGLELSAFFLQFIQWWQTDANKGNLTNLPVPEAPAYDSNSGKYAGVCPICIQPWLIPTAVTVSGYVYCYKCIVTTLDAEQRCPVTNYPATVDNLIRIFNEWARVVFIIVNILFIREQGCFLYFKIIKDFVYKTGW